MEPQSVQPRLTAVLSDNVKGYSRLMGEDEVQTIRTLPAYQEIMAVLVQRHRGRVVDSRGTTCWLSLLAYKTLQGC